MKKIILLLCGVSLPLWAGEPVVSHPSARAIKMAPPPMEARKPMEEIVTVRGTVRTEYDDQGVPNAIFIEGEDGQEYRVMIAPVTQPIAALNGRKVEIVALLENKADVLWLDVRSFRPLPLPESGRRLRPKDYGVERGPG